MGTATVTCFWPLSMFPIMAPQHSFGNLASAWPTITPHASESILIIPERFTQIFGRAVGKYGHDDAAPSFLDQPSAYFAGGAHVGARRHSDEQTLMAAEPARHSVRVFGFDPQVVVGQLR